MRLKHVSKVRWHLERTHFPTGFSSCILTLNFSCLFVPFVKNEEARGSSRSRVSSLHMCHDRATAGDEKWGSHLSPPILYLYIPAIVPQYKVDDVRSIMQSALLCSCCSPQHFVYSKIELPRQSSLFGLHFPSNSFYITLMMENITINSLLFITRGAGLICFLSCFDERPSHVGKFSFVINLVPDVK